MAAKQQHQSVGKTRLEARTEVTTEGLYSLKRTRRAQTLRSTDKKRFDKYRNYLKNCQISLAVRINSNHTKTKPELLS
ncbi:hypothetical protein P3T76_005064 [Phytophthora citrophthora]|uniref:Uncharacterized protein n=1 Tax=Phytophthora citrophthora TaxID=4793 RepID=A0AAD9GSF4_9STRA|nr:hypothetical protein P3T76_005057 [Phytophthora citrophthora]KAK1943666.1 hypothetical protein P3T76_005062 [Phytophthora citrophthora]KAK1943668.1 hypothetical protein P3T76_005064 [Phytophthora citrophthora]